MAKRKSKTQIAADKAKRAKAAAAKKLAKEAEAAAAAAASGSESNPESDPPSSDGEDDPAAAKQIIQLGKEMKKMAKAMAASASAAPRVSTNITLSKTDHASLKRCRNLLRDLNALKGLPPEQRAIIRDLAQELKTEVLERIAPDLQANAEKIEVALHASVGQGQKDAEKAIEKINEAVVEITSSIGGNVLGMIEDILELLLEHIPLLTSKGSARPSGRAGTCHICNKYVCLVCRKTSQLFFSLPFFQEHNLLHEIPARFHSFAIRLFFSCLLALLPSSDAYATYNSAAIVLAPASLRKSSIFSVFNSSFFLAPIHLFSPLLLTIKGVVTGPTHAQRSRTVVPTVETVTVTRTGTVTETVIVVPPAPADKAPNGTDAADHSHAKSTSTGSAEASPAISGLKDVSSSDAIGVSTRRSSSSVQDASFDEKFLIAADSHFSNKSISGITIPQIAGSRTQPASAQPKSTAPRRLLRQTPETPVHAAPADERISARATRLRSKEKREAATRALLYASNGDPISLFPVPPPALCREASIALSGTSQGPNDTPPHLRLQAALPFWRETIQADARTLHMIEHGADVPLAYPLPANPIHIAPYKLHADEQAFITAEIHSLVARGCMSLSRIKPPCILPLFTVPKVLGDGTTSLRLVLDATALNAFFPNVPFCAASINDVINSLHQDDLSSVFDLSNAYYHIPLPAWISNLLAVEANLDGELYYAHYLAAPFGYGLSALFLYWLLNNLSNFWKRMRIRNTFFGDDLHFPMRCNARNRRVQTSLILHHIFLAGFESNVLKHQILLRTFVFIGFKIDADTNLLWLKDKRREKAQQRSILLSKKEKWSCREITKCTGCYTSTAAVSGHLAILFTRSLNRFLAVHSVHGWDALHTPANEARGEIQWWIDYLNKPGPNRPLRRPPAAAGYFSAPRTTLSTSDASGIGSGFALISTEAISIPTTVSSAFSSDMQLMSSVYRENAVVIEGVRTYTTILANSDYTALVDAPGSVSPLLYGSSVPELQQQALTLRAITAPNNIRISVVWQPRDDPLAVLADALSRRAQYDVHDWTLRPTTFALIAAHIYSRYHLLPGIDLFADKTNTLTKSFYSLFYQPGSLGASVLDHPLPHIAHKYYVAVPPPPLLTQFISRLPLPSPVLLILPQWPTHPSNAQLFPLNQPRPFPFDILQPLTAAAFKRGPIGKPTFIPSSNQLFHVLFIHAL